MLEGIYNKKPAAIDAGFSLVSLFRFERQCRYSPLTLISRAPIQSTANSK